MTNDKARMSLQNTKHPKKRNQIFFHPRKKVPTTKLLGLNHEEAVIRWMTLSKVRPHVNDSDNVINIHFHHQNGPDSCGSPFRRWKRMQMWVYWLTAISHRLSLFDHPQEVVADVTAPKNPAVMKAPWESGGYVTRKQKKGDGKLRLQDVPVDTPNNDGNKQSRNWKDFQSG